MSGFPRGVLRRFLCYFLFKAANKPILPGRNPLTLQLSKGRLISSCTRGIQKCSPGSAHRIPSSRLHTPHSSTHRSGPHTALVYTLHSSTHHTGPPPDALAHPSNVLVHCSKALAHPLRHRGSCHRQMLSIRWKIWPRENSSFHMKQIMKTKLFCQYFLNP